ncbi:MAG: EamA family transporter [Deltaproteobacteria bacterium]|nr:EamA family transporter [Deltaproteobacteria bacterium]
MLWFSLSILAAFFSATEAAYLKRRFGDRSPMGMNGVLSAYSLPFLLAALILLDLSPPGNDFWATMAVLIPVNALGTILHITAINISPLSLTMPYLAATPAFALGIAYVILGETPSAGGVAGIAVLIVGSYVLNLGTAPDGGRFSLGPFRAMFRERGSRLMLGAAMIYGLTAVLGKKIVLQSDPLAAAIFFGLALHVTVLTLALTVGRIRCRDLFVRPGPGLMVGALQLAHLLCHFTAVSLVTTAYMVAVKRLNGLFGVIYGGLIFREGRMPVRLAGAGLMALGAAVIALFG